MIQRGVGRSLLTLMRRLATTAPAAAHDEAILFGGAAGNLSFSSDTWAWDGTSWAQKLPQTSPPARYSHAMAYDAAHGQIVLFGGNDPNHVNSEFDDTWTWEAAPFQPPSAV